MTAEGVYSVLDDLFDSSIEVININAQFENYPTTLLITVENMNSDKRAHILFKQVKGFRVLDEGDIVLLWKDSDRPTSSIWKIISDGWFDDERNNEGFTMLQTISIQIVEYLIIGEGMCVNVICDKDELPTIEVMGRGGSVSD
jgi:hypothetical protein